MRKRLRPQVVVPVAVLALVVVGFAAFAFKGNQGTSEPVASSLPLPAVTTEQPAEPAAPKTALDKALKKHPVVVVVLYTPDASVDSLAAREARAGAEAVRAGFLAVDVTDESAVAEFAQLFDVRQAPALLVVERGPKVVSQISGYADRATVAQAAEAAQLAL